MTASWRSCVLLAAIVAACSGGERTIPDVAALEALEAFEPHRLATGWEVRLGLGEAGADAGPWRLLYCLARYVGDDAKPSFSVDGKVYGRLLGPVFCTTSGEARAVSQMAMWASAPREGLFCSLVLVAWEGAYKLRVVSPKGRTLAQRELVVKTPRPCPWQQFARGRRTLAREGEPSCCVRAKAYAACPSFGECASIWPPSDRQVEFAARQGGTPLPGRIPLGGPWEELLGAKEVRQLREGERRHPLRLTLDGKAFVVRAGVKMVDWPDLHVLARWWVNGRPVIPKRSEGMEMIQLGRLLSYAREMKVAVGWPDSLGNLGEGDKVGLQVLYSPGMTEQIPRKRADGKLLCAAFAGDEDVARVPLLSNRIDFTITQALLDARSQAAREK